MSQWHEVPPAVSGDGGRRYESRRGDIAVVTPTSDGAYTIRAWPAGSGASYRFHVLVVSDNGPEGDTSPIGLTPRVVGALVEDHVDRWAERRRAITTEEVPS